MKKELTVSLRHKENSVVGLNKIEIQGETTKRISKNAGDEAGWSKTRLEKKTQTN